MPGYECGEESKSPGGALEKRKIKDRLDQSSDI